MAPASTAGRRWDCDCRQGRIGDGASPLRKFARFMPATRTTEYRTENTLVQSVIYWPTRYGFAGGDRL